ncbi:LysR family transcriptional regulator [Marinomonas rhizomae]|uniref:LysR family transcriptional regulator n=1 Tax=Marinomonas rhizomae TaxID=491948 RepID=A0A366JFA2_9GAMM|nr:LysR family transcriptional regulator [Marinomonas rhizomae]RBP85623.1 LysR family transcriptional regulator [Marinomonas rhizomae]RNF75749.1 LysR family transcriptional regulator [Marinomonas rhizomae]
MNEMIWDDTKAFLALARCGTLTVAAKSLDMGIATLSRKIERLERSLQTPLFLRFQTGYQLTDEGKSLLSKAEAMETAAFAFTKSAEKESQLTGRVKVATAENLATHLILPALGRFQKTYPNLHIDIVTDIHTANLHRRDADLALRMVRPTNGNVSFQRVGTLGYGLYCSTHYQKERNHDNDNFIQWGEHYEHLPAAQWISNQLAGKEPIITTTSVATQVSACLAGIGMAILPHPVARPTKLVCLADIPEINQDIYLVIQTDLTQSKRIRAVADFLSELVKTNQDQLKT